MGAVCEQRRRYIASKIKASPSHEWATNTLHYTRVAPKRDSVLVSYVLQPSPMNNVFLLTYVLPLQYTYIIPDAADRFLIKFENLVLKPAQPCHLTYNY